MTKKKAKAKHFVFLNLMKQKYHHKIVRDLAWCISSPELLNETLSFGDNIMKDYFLEFQEKLTKLDKNSLELETFLSHKNTLRLGHYYEALICFWLQNSIKFDLLANNVPLRNQEKITIGEVDLIVFNKITKDYEHWELAVKFYLAYIKKGQTDYIGPNANDHFHLKLAKLKNYQCKILETVPGKKYLSELNISKIKNKLLVKGLLCYHPNDIKKPWENISVQHAQSWWIYLEEAQEFLDDALKNINFKKVDSILFNCSQPEVMERAIITAKNFCSHEILIGVYANTFPPINSSQKEANNQIMEMRKELDPASYLVFAENWQKAGASIIGGCCGIGPEHIKELNKLR